MPSSTTSAARIAMWSGPRNLSTAMMYSFGARTDCAVWDEPYYAAYLRATGLDHPMAAGIIAAYETDPAQVGAACARLPDARPIFYQKHMTHHMLPAFDLGWLAQVTNVFLIRHPARVIASYQQKRENPTLADLGFEQQLALFRHAWDLTGERPVVVDSADILAAPEPMLRALCTAIGIPFDATMLSWPAGGHAADGIWASHWYNAVHASTGFGDAEGSIPDLQPPLADLLPPALAIYQHLKPYALTADSR